LTLYKPKVYTASKLSLFTYWRALRKDPDWSFVEWTASWPMEQDSILEADAPVEGFQAAWEKDIREVKSSDFLLLYGRDQSAHLRGALVEAGAAIASGIRVIAVGLGLSEGHTWAFHRLVICLPTMVEARHYLYKFTTMAPPNRSGRPKTSEED
jgi:hypothetical protein